MNSTATPAIATPRPAKRGRKPKPVTPPTPRVTIHIVDERATTRAANNSLPQLVAAHWNVDGSLTPEQVRRHFGVGVHLTIYRDNEVYSPGRY